MSKFPLLLLILITAHLIVFAQGHGKGGGGSTSGSGSSSGSSVTSTSPAGASSPAANSGSQQTGYVYRLPWRYHLKYGSVHSVMNSVRIDSPRANMTISTTVITRDTIKCDTTKSLFRHAISRQKVKRGHNPCPNTIMDTVIHALPPVTTCTPAGNASCTQGSPATQTDIRIDSITRYWDQPWTIFKRHRLKVSITQADSGKLQIGIYDRGFQPVDKPVPREHIHFAILEVDGVETDDYAIPISANDSAQNFYLQIHNKLLVGQPLTYISIPYALTQYGAMVIPYKFRWAPRNKKIYVKGPQNPADTVVSAPSESTGNINLALYLGRKWGTTRFFFDQTKTRNTLSFMVSGFIGASLISLSSANIAYPKYTDSLPAQTIAFTCGGAATVEWKGIDLGLFTGWDFTSAKMGWIYNKKLWLGFGVGVNLGMFTSGPTQLQF